MTYIPYFSTLVVLVFTVAVFRRYQKKGGLHLLLWAFGLLLYGIGTLTEVVLGLTFSEVALKAWYISGAMLTAAWLGQGSIQFLVKKERLVKVLTYILSALSVLAIYLVISAPLTGAESGFNPAVPASLQYKEIMTRGGLTIAMTIILNIYGTIGLVGGALYSAFLFWRKQVMVNRMFGNILIAAGALAPAMAGTFVKAGLVDMLYVSEFVGAVLMFAGFMLSTTDKK